VTERLSTKHEAWCVQQQVESGEIALDEDSHLAAWFAREYEVPALYTDEGGQG
jgi:hypothetical protein